MGSRRARASRSRAVVGPIAQTGVHTLMCYSITKLYNHLLFSAACGYQQTETPYYQRKISFEVTWNSSFFHFVVRVFEAFRDDDGVLGGHHKAEGRLHVHLSLSPRQQGGMTSTVDTASIGKARARKHVRTLTGWSQ
jgi:hypothetical protein